jgi:hypothetical protein
VDFSAIAKQDFWKTIDLPLDERTRLSLSPRLRVSVVRFWFRSARHRPRPYGANQANLPVKRGFLGDSQAGLLENDRPESPRKNQASPFSAPPRLRGEVLVFARRISGLALMVPTKPNLSCRNVDFSAIVKQDFWKTIDLPLDERTRLRLSPRLRVSVVKLWVSFPPNISDPRPSAFIRGKRA